MSREKIMIILVDIHLIVARQPNSCRCDIHRAIYWWHPHRNPFCIQNNKMYKTLYIRALRTLVPHSARYAKRTKRYGKKWLIKCNQIKITSICELAIYMIVPLYSKKKIKSVNSQCNMQILNELCARIHANVSRNKNGPIENLKNLNKKKNKNTTHKHELTHSRSHNNVGNWIKANAVLQHIIPGPFGCIIGVRSVHKANVDDWTSHRISWILESGANE